MYTTQVREYKNNDGDMDREKKVSIPCSIQFYEGREKNSDFYPGNGSNPLSAFGRLTRLLARIGERS
jgi:hypothetical protein